MKTVFFLLTLVLGFSQPVAAQVLWRASDHVTPGGLPFRHVRLPLGQTQALQFGWRDGFAAARPNGKGIAAFGPTMIIQGPVGMSRNEFIEEVKDTQGQLYLASTPEFTIGGIFSPPEKFPTAIQLFAQTLKNPALDAARLEDLRKAQLAAIAQASTQPVVLANRVGAAVLWEDATMLGWTRDDPAHFTGTSLADIQAWRQSIVSRAGLMIAAAGPFTADEAAREIDRLFGELPAQGQSPVAPLLTRKEVSGAIVLEANVPQTFVLLGGWSGFQVGNDQMIGAIGAKALQARLFKEIREKLGASYGASAQLVGLISKPFVFSLNSSVAHDRAPEVLAVMQREYQKFLIDGISQYELDGERLRVKTEFEESIRRPPMVASFLRDALFNSKPANVVENFLARLSALTLEETNSTLKAGLLGKKISTVVVAPKADVFPKLCAIKRFEDATACETRQ